MQTNTQYESQLVTLAQLLFHEAVEFTEFSMTEGRFALAITERGLGGFIDQPNLDELIGGVLCDADVACRSEKVIDYPAVDQGIYARYRISGPVESLAAIQTTIREMIQSAGGDAIECLESNPSEASFYKAGGRFNNPT
ncbi:hypothetical protein ACFQBQ_00830 [Granulicella cerasi]|uniref:Uncharacterized protein n=1 Tax=Granulicella cerasi TaxID=741063 RepID=A0ABW1Z436_9BACT|nr:hypothetical protein [Granulicella cerasi]